MNKQLFLHFLSVVALLTILLLGACASYKKNFFSKTYHNTTAKYNAYFIANEDIRQVELAIESDQKNNYNKILGVFYDIDSATIDGVRSQLEDAIKKASLAIQRHENSKWVYPSYYLVGKSRYYGGDFENAITTFKYIIKYSEEKDIRHQASIALMRTFIDYKEYRNAVSVADYLRKEKLNKDNQKTFLLTKAYLFQIREDYTKLLANLSQAVELEPHRKKRARLYFTLGQLYQKLGYEDESYNNYKRCLKSNPAYELSFYAKLNMAQVIRLDEKVALKKIRGYFKKLLKDAKNREFIDRIYYEMANFEINHNNQDQAVTYLKSSVHESLDNPRQKGKSYLKLGELYYNYYKNYQLAQAYYDSTVNVLPQDEENFEEIKKRASILSDFVTQLQTIHLQDSLLNLARMNKQALQQMLEEEVAEQERQEKLARKEARKLARQNTSAQPGQMSGSAFANPFGIDDKSPTEGETWYFYNMSALATGRSQFKTKWGNRPLEDHWRRAQKQQMIPLSAEQETASAEEQVTSEDVADNMNGGDKVSELMNTIPFSEEQQDKAKKQIEDAFYKLGGIYNFELEEKQNAIETYETLLSRFPGSTYEPETLYLLYLAFQTTDEEKASKYKSQLTSDYPTTIYAHLAINPNYEQESNETTQRLKRLYEIAYDYYLSENFDQARTLVSRGIQQYPDNKFSDRLRILGILLDGKLEGQYKYQYELQQFVKDYPDSKFVDYAKALLTASKDFETNELKRKGARYITYFDQPHFFIFVYPNLEGFSELIPSIIEKYIDEKYTGKSLKTGNLSLNEGFSMVLINKFMSKEEAMDFYNNFNKIKLIFPETGKAEYENFVITEDNFQIFFQAKTVEEYIQFFKKYYKKQDD